MNIKIHIRRRLSVYDNHLPISLPPLLRRLYSLRGIKNEQELERSINSMLHWKHLSGIDTAVNFLEKALTHRRTIIIVGDFDVDGATSIALTVLALRSMGGIVDYLVPNRFKDGYGLSPEIVEKAVLRGADLIITVDNGISSHAGVEKAHANGVKVVITDHHLPSKTLPIAEAIVNPNLNGCQFASKCLAGVGVAFYLMLALRARLRNNGWFTRQTLAMPNLATLMDLVALGTVADIVPLDRNNRILVYQGLHRIRARKCRLGILALLEVANCDVQQLVASDLSFMLGPRLNAAGRLDDMSVGVALLLSNDVVQIRRLANDLNMLNQKRRKIEKTMQIEAIHLCHQLERTNTKLPYGLTIYHPKWHQGVVGNLAARIKEHFYRPVIAFASIGHGILKGSGRSITGLHIRNALERLDILSPGLMMDFGGHAMAVGLLIKEQRFDEFCHRFTELMSTWLNPKLLEAVIWSDGELSMQDLSLATAKMLRDSGPWGEAFPEPTFDGTFHILKQKLIAKQHLQLIVKPLSGGPVLNGIAFNVNTTIWPDLSVQEVELSYKLHVNKFRGRQSLKLLIQHLWPH